jgi:hypothetical protein
VPILAIANNLTLADISTATLAAMPPTWTTRVCLFINSFFLEFFFGFYSDCCRKGGVKGSCVDVCNGANPPGWPNPKYMDCKQYGSINVCNQNAAQEADNEKTLKSNSEAKMTKPLAQKHMGMKDNVKHLEHLVVQQA